MGLALAACLALAMLLTMSGFPGVLETTACLWLPTFGLGGIIGLFYWANSLRPTDTSSLQDGSPPKSADGSPLLWRRRKAVVVMALLGEVILLMGGVPMRLAFALSKPSFEELLRSVPVSDYGGKELGRWLGVYHVDRIATDLRGGVYFRSNTGPDGIGPDTMSYGFAYRPNATGSPFGRCGYSYSRLVGDWYYFNASNDY